MEYQMHAIVLAYNSEVTKAETFMARQLKPSECLSLWMFLMNNFKLVETK